MEPIGVKETPFRPSESQTRMLVYPIHFPAFEDMADQPRYKTCGEECDDPLPSDCGNTDDRKADQQDSKPSHITVSGSNGYMPGMRTTP